MNNPPEGKTVNDTPVAKLGHKEAHEWLKVDRETRYKIQSSISNRSFGNLNKIEKRIALNVLYYRFCKDVDMDILMTREELYDELKAEEKALFKMACSASYQEGHEAGHESQIRKISRLQKEMLKKNTELEAKKAKIEENHTTIEELHDEIERSQTTIEEKDAKIKEKNTQIQEMNAKIVEQDSILEALDQIQKKRTPRK